MKTQKLFSRLLVWLSIFLLFSFTQVHAQDTDGDDVPNITDVDDDNDGILDVDEQPCNEAVYWSRIGTNTNANLTTDDAQTIEFAVSGPPLGSVGSIPDYAQFSSYADVPTDRRNFNVETPGTYLFDFQDNDGNPISILNPYILISSLGSLADLDYVTFSEVYEVVYVNPNGNTVFVNQQTVEATGGYFVVRFPGEHSSISIETDVDVDRFSAVWGIDCTAFPHDNDKDGIPNKEDLDSDNDGCSDANEAYVDPNADGGDDGVYGTGTPNENPDGSVVGAPYTTGYVVATTYASDPTVCGARNPNTDLDDDNDGVLDTDEFTCDSGVYWADLTITPSLGLITAGDNSITRVTTATGSTSTILDYGNFSGYPDMPADTRSYHIHAGGTNTFTFSDFDNPSGTYAANTPYMILSGLGANRDNPEKVVFNVPYEVVYTSPTSDVAYADPTTIIGYGAYVVVRFPGSHSSISVTSDNNLLRTSLLLGVSCPDFDFDSDNDGIPNRLDTDSDNDGCSDANEAYGDPNADGGDDGIYGSGTPIENPDGTVVGATYGTGFVEDTVLPGRYTICADDDNDNDDYDDRVDLDDDNDGILDTEESRCTQNILWGFWDRPGPMEAEIATPEGMVDVTVSGPNFGTFHSIQGYSEGDFDNYPDAPSNRRSAFPERIGEYTFTFSQPVENTYLLMGNLGGVSRAKSISFDRPYEVVYKNPSDDIQFGGNRIIGNGGSAVIRFPGNYTSFTMRIEYTNINWISLVVGLECMPFDFDDDGDGVPNVFDLDSDGDGCSDANEAYNDPGADGGDGMEYALGSPPPVNNDGTVVGAPYTAPADADSSGTPDYREIPSSPDPIILQQPEDATVCPDTRAVFRVVASNANEYQWQELNNGVWQDILTGTSVYTGVDSDILIIDPATVDLNGMRYRVIVRNTDGSVCSTLISDEVLLTVEDAEDPSASDPDPLSVQCDSEVPVPNVAVVIDEADNCTVPPTVTFQGETVSGNVITRTYRVSDDAGNFIDVTHIITVADTEDPTASDPAPLIVQCESEVPAPDVSVVLDEADNCTVPPTVTFQGETRTGDVITRTYRVSDDAGNFIDVTHIITVADTEDPTASDPAPLVVQCESEVPAPDVSVVLDEADNCTVPPTVTFQGEARTGDVITRTYRVSDDAGNFIDVAHLITVNDTIGPVPIVENLPIAEGLCPLRLEPPSANDNCSGMIVATTSDDMLFTEAGNYSITWIYEDEQGNRTEQEQEVIVVCDADLTVEKTADKLEAFEGETVVFTITITNNGSISATKIEVWDVLPNGFQYENHITTMGTYDVEQGIWTIPIMTPGERVALEMETTMLAGQDHTNVVEIISMDQPDARMENNRAEVTISLLANEDCLVIFNEFTPNNDGVNDFFYIECIENYPDNYLEVFNRWGTKVFETKNYQNGWSGTNMGNTVLAPDENLPVGTYYYVLSFPNGDRNAETGWLYLTR